MNQVKSVRIKAGISQVELAARAGTSQAYISEIESGKTKPSLGMLEAIAKALGCKLTILLEEK